MAEKKILVVLPPYRFNDKQFEICRRVWEGRGYRVVVASLERSSAVGENGMSVPVDALVKDVKTWDYDAFVFLGGEGTKRLFDDESVRKLAKDAKYKVMGASDQAVVLLSLAGAIEDKKVAGPVDMVQWLLQGKAKYTGEPLQIDDKLITIRGPEMSEQLANAVINALEK
jgi:protease I